MDSPMKKLSERLDELSRRERQQTTQVRSILNGAVRFIEEIGAQQRVVDTLFGEFSRLEVSGARYAQQKVELSSQRETMMQLKRVAEAVVEWAKRPAAGDLPEDEIERVWAEGIMPMLRAEQMRRIRALRIQGPVVDIKRVLAEKCNGMRTEALVRMARHITRATSDPHSGLDGLWRWISKDGSIWLYHHHETEKWKCLYFRITVHRLLENLSFSLESYVPFGFGADPAQYEMTSSNVFIRPKWRTTNVNSMTYNATNTFNVQTTFTRTLGVSLGESLTTNTGESLQDGTSDTDSEGWSSSQTSGESSSWSSNWSESFSGAGGGGGHSSGQGSSGGRNQSYTTNENYGRSQSRSHSKTTSVGEAFGVQTNLTDSVSNAISGGFARAVGEALQVGVWAYGIDFGKSTKLHLEQWRHGNGDAAVIFDHVHLLFETMCKDITEQLQAMASGAGVYEDEELAKRLPEISQHMLVQDSEGTRAAGAIESGERPLLEPGHSRAERSEVERDDKSGPLKAR